MNVRSAQFNLYQVLSHLIGFALPDIFLPRIPNNEPCEIATHSRVGRDGACCSVLLEDEDEREEITYFLPKISRECNCYANLSPTSGLENCRQWFLIAQAHGATIQLFCLPLGWKQNEDIYEKDHVIEEDSSNENDIPFYLTSKLMLPAEGRILRIGFYGDDGKSSLSSGVDSGTGMEGRQKIAFKQQR